MSKFQLVQVWLLLLLVGSTAHAIDVPAKHDSWGKFKPGSWRRLRVITETIDAKGKVTATAKTVTTKLLKVEEDGVTLEETVQADADTKKPPATVTKFGWEGLPTSLKRTEKLTVDEYQVDGKTLPCIYFHVSAREGEAETTAKVWYCPDKAPFVFKRLIKTTGGKTDRALVIEVTRLGVAQKVLDKELVCFETESNLVTAASKTKDTSLHSLEIPGGLVRSTIESRDNDQDVTAKVRVELDAFEVAK